MNPQQNVGIRRHGRLIGVLASIALILGVLTAVSAGSASAAAPAHQASVAAAAVHVSAGAQVRTGLSIAVAGTHGRIAWEGPCTCGKTGKPGSTHRGHRRHHHPGHRRHHRGHRHPGHRRHHRRPHPITTLYPVPPTVTQPACTGPGTSSPGSAVSATTPGIAYTYTDLVGHVLDAANLPDGDVLAVASLTGKYTRLGDANGFVSGHYKFNVKDAGACLVTVTPAPPTVTNNPSCKPGMHNLTGTVTDQSQTGITNTVTDLQTGGVSSGRTSFAVAPGHSKMVTQIAAFGYIFPDGMAQVQSTYTNTLNPKTMCPQPSKHHRGHRHPHHRHPRVKKPAKCYRLVLVRVLCKAKCH